MPMRYIFLTLIGYFALIPLTFAANQGGITNTPHLAKFSKAIEFSLPLACQMGENCWVMNYVDFTPDDGLASDPFCGPRTYDSHKGTDFAILDGTAMEKGVSVLAPLDGTVLKIRDGEPDQWSTPQQIEQIKAARKECGNAIMVDHGEGLQTVYCHLKKGSIKVKPNQKIKIGDVMAQVGLSGMTEFPHLHFGITKDNKVIDPFTNETNMDRCGIPKKSLWDRKIDLQYQPFTIQSAGFSNDVPDLNKLEKGIPAPESLSTQNQYLTFWSILYGVKKDDIVTLEMTDPNGKKFADFLIIQDKDRARQFYYIGKNIENLSLQEGAYLGTIKIKRKVKDKEDLVDSKTVTVLVLNQ